MKRKRYDNLERVMNSVVRVRKPGEEPEQSLHSFDEFECDLCKGMMPREGITQCSFCGRWICKDSCWDKDNMSCISCAGIIMLSKSAGNTDDAEIEASNQQDIGVKENIIRSGHKLKNILKS